MAADGLPVALLALLLSACCAWLVGWLVMRFEPLHAHLTADHVGSGPQKFHLQPTPRIGGLPIFCGFAAGLILATGLGVLASSHAVAFCASLLPAFASGLVEDLTKRIGPDIRLWAGFLSALVALLFFDAVVSEVGVPGLDNLLAWYPIALCVTVVAVGGLGHAVNIIDGYNGLAGGVSTMMLVALGYVSWQVGDMYLLLTCASLAGATLGFLLWNFPSGRMFAGDGGAYLWGIAVAIIGIQLVHRNPQVTPWLPLAVAIYPAFETVFSMYRRKFKHSAAGQPDAKHLHQLVYRRLMPKTPGRNASTSVVLWVLAATAILPAAAFWSQPAALAATVLAFCLLYVWAYRAIATFRTPRWLRSGAATVSRVGRMERAREAAQ